jgi:hypothetical protein
MDATSEKSSAVYADFYCPHYTSCSNHFIAFPFPKSPTFVPTPASASEQEAEEEAPNGFLP